MYIVHGDLMSDIGIAKIFMHGRSQAVRLPLAFRLPGDRVRVRRVEGGILLEPNRDGHRRLVRGTGPLYRCAVHGRGASAAANAHG
jgi:hypothetical protein